MASETKERCISPWIFLAFAVLTKGPVALILAFLTLTTFLLTQKEWRNLCTKINLKLGLLITFLISFPWYFLELIKEGKPFWDSFFGYHNFQRYTSVVNNHSEPIWFFLYIMILGSLPLTPFLFHGISEAIKDLLRGFNKACNSSETLFIYALCWLGSVVIFFSISATKLPSYWLPATPAAAILMSNSFIKLKIQNRNYFYFWIFTFFILFGLSAAFFFSNNWLNLINDPEMPYLAEDLLRSGIIFKAKLLFSLLAFVAFIFNIFRSKNALLYIQILLLFGQIILMPPIRKLGDSSRQLPLRSISRLISEVREGQETLAMIGVRKPSLHYYSRQIVFYEPSTQEGLINLSERLNYDRRKNYQDIPNYDFSSLLVVIDDYSSREEHWLNLNHQNLGRFGIYNLWRIRKTDLNESSNFLIKDGFKSNWRYRLGEKF